MCKVNESKCDDPNLEKYFGEGGIIAKLNNCLAKQSGFCMF